MRRRVLSFWLLSAALSSLIAAGPEVQQARKFYDRAAYRSAVQILSPLATTAQDPDVVFWLGRSYFMLGDYKKSAEAFEKAIALRPGESEYRHWLGMSYGRRAETSNPLIAPGLASKARQNFEKAVELDPNNMAAIDDLFDYYLEAPGFLGGGLDKAEALAAKIQKTNPSQYHYAIAQLAEKRKDWNRAEEHLRRAVELAPRQVARILDLGRFLAKQGRYQESDTVFARAEKINPDEPRILYERADAYIRAKQKLDDARQLLQKYIRMPLGPDDPPVADAQKLLKQIAGA